MRMSEKHSRSRKQAEELFNISELRYYKQKNQELLKALTSQKQLCSKYLQERNDCLTENVALQTIINKYQQALSTVNKCSHNTIEVLMGFSAELRNSLKNVTDLSQANMVPQSLNVYNSSENVVNSFVNSGCSSSKTRAVRPMVAGHMISFPSVKIMRVNNNNNNSSSGADAHINSPLLMPFLDRDASSVQDVDVQRPSTSGVNKMEGPEDYSKKLSTLKLLGLQAIDHLNMCAAPNVPKRSRRLKQLRKTLTSRPIVLLTRLSTVRPQNTSKEEKKTSTKVVQGRRKKLANFQDVAVRKKMKRRK